MRRRSHVFKMDPTPFEFSENGEFAIHSSYDGVVKVWESATNTLKNEYKPSSHLSASCSCLSWCPSSKVERVEIEMQESVKKKKRKNNNIESLVEKLQLVAIGTVSGSILLYSAAKGSLHSQMDDGHSGKVNSIVWYPENDCLYSCSDDRHVIEWEISTSKLIHKFKSDKYAVHSLCKCSSEFLLAAGRSIRLWNVKTRLIVATFTGHATAVFRMLHVPSRTTDSIEKSYFLSAASNDRLINAWQIETSKKHRYALASFTMPSEPVDMHISQQTDEPLILVVVTKCGKALLYEHKLNGHLKAPLNPLVTIQISSTVKNAEVPRPIHILAAYLCDEDSHNLLLVHGRHLRPNFEKVSYSTSQPELNLVREEMTAAQIKKEKSVSKVRTPEVSKDVTVLVPGQMAPIPPSQDTQTSKRKRKASVGEMTLEDRLNAVSLEKPNANQQRPKADTSVSLLVQGLQSQDQKILNQVLGKGDKKLIMNTIRKLPVQMVIPLVQELTRRMHGHSQMCMTQVSWIQAVLTVHTSYLMTFPEIIETMSTLYQMMDSRVTMLGKLSRLKGKLDIMLSQISAQTQEEEPGVNQQPLLQFEEESSEDEDDLEELAIGPGVSDSEDNWEDFSDAESDMDTQDDVNGKG